MALPVRYHDLIVEAGNRMDMLLDGVVVVENRAVQALLPVQAAQLLTYLERSRHQLGFLVHWNGPLIDDVIRRLANEL